MQILQIVTLVSPDGSYGGPVTVAMNQSRALTDRGHSVEVAATHRGYARPPKTLRGIKCHLFKARNLLPQGGFAWLFSVRLLLWLMRNAQRFDVVHIHMARDLVTLPAARLTQLMGRPVVIQTHGMVDPSHRRLAKALDIALTVPTLRRAKKVCYLTDIERSDLQLVANINSSLVRVRNGVPAIDVGAESEREVLFMARLHQRKRPLVFVEAALALAPSFPDVKFALVGPDGGEGRSISIALQGLETDQITWEGAVSPEFAVERLSRAQIYVLPSVDEPYPMSVLEAMSLGLPVIISESCGLAGDVSATNSGLVIDHDPQSLIEALKRLLTNDCQRTQMASNALEASRLLFSMERVIDQLESTYAEAAGMK